MRYTCMMMRIAIHIVTDRSPEFGDPVNFQRNLHDPVTTSKKVMTL